jgi:integrase
MAIPTADQLIRAHLTALSVDLSPNTVEDAGKVLRAAHGQLPIGLSAPDGQVAATEELTEWLANGRTRTGQPWTAQTRSTYRQHLQRYYRWLLVEEIIDWDPTATLRSPRVSRGTPRPATDEQARIAVTDLPAPWLLGARLAAYEGLRCIEMVRLDREHVTVTETQVWGKGDRRDVIPTHPRVWEVVQGMPDGPLITRPRRNGPATDKWMSQEGARQLRRVGVNIGMHQLRHWYGTMLLRTTGNMEKVRQLMRHRSMSSTQIYTLVHFDELRAAVLGLPDISR